MPVFHCCRCHEKNLQSNQSTRYSWLFFILIYLSERNRGETAQTCAKMCIKKDRTVCSQKSVSLSTLHTLWFKPVFTRFLSHTTHLRGGPNLASSGVICRAVYGGSEGRLSAPIRLFDGWMNFWHVRNFGRLTQALTQLKQGNESIHQSVPFSSLCLRKVANKASECHGNTHTTWKKD